MMAIRWSLGPRSIDSRRCRRNSARFGSPVSWSWRACHSFSRVFASSSTVACWSECVRVNICRAKAMGAMNTVIDQGPIRTNVVATTTLNRASPR
ncbi:MAG: hypothetical protein KatS3mg014_0035 [Actinomycetota bacterium]|nr:MAG: hypothetical protein KatS3mg014_0035 [Actinomycetota bacterium]